MAKKKKTQLKPVSRGFATTSVPKKMVEKEPDAVPEEQENRPDAIVDTHPTTGAQEGPSVSAGPDKQLQTLVDKLQEKTEKEITRMLKAIETDRRFADTLPRFELDWALQEQILALAHESQPEEEEIPKLVTSEEKSLSRFGVVYGILRRLGFNEDHTMECLAHTNCFELDDALAWLYLHHPQESLTKEDTLVNIRRTTSLSTEILHLSPPSTPRSSGKGQDKGASKPVDTQRQEIALIKTRIFAGISLDDSSDDASTMRFVHLKLKLDDLSAQPRKGYQVEKRAILELLKEQSEDAFFDDRKAESFYTAERMKKLMEKLSSVPVEEPSSASPSPTPSPVVQSEDRNEIVQSSPGPDLFDGSDDDGSGGGLFGILEEAELGAVTERGVTIAFKDTPLPKGWSGQTPKSMLRDLVQRRDKYATISYSVVSGRSRAARASVTICWQSGKREEWLMDNVACREESQAEQYISTYALHALSYPLTDGFAAMNPLVSGSPTSFRLLPPPYRNLWDELETERKARLESTNTEVWRKLQDLLQEKMDSLNAVSAKATAQAGAGLLRRPPRDVQDDKNATLSDSLVLNFAVRQATPAYQAMLAQRNTLPIAAYRNNIIAALETSQVVVLSGETGCGKSTQLPAFILEDHLSRGQHCKIYCTEPRRISAISLAQRVSYELCDPPNSVGSQNALVGYSIRLENNISKHTRLAYVTNGIALRMLESGSGPSGQGMAFDEITHIIVDEVHERSIESDFLLIVLKKLIQERSNLKVVLMSATLDADKISHYFGDCQVLRVTGRTFPVDVRYLEDAIELTKWRVTKESVYARKINDKFYQGKNRMEWSEDANIDDDDDDSTIGPERRVADIKLERRYSPETTTTLNTFDERLIPYELIIRLLEVICFENPAYYSSSTSVLIFMPGLADIRKLNEMLGDHPLFGTEEFIVLPLHSTLSTESQSAVFDIPPPGIRKIVIATNIAETGITIPDVTCVIDSGKHREMRFDEKRQISRLVQTFIAKSNAAQRRGRAGRVQAGLCFHLFTKLRHDNLLADAPLPEMLRLSLSDLALRLKSMKVKLGSSIEDVLSRALDPPIPINVQRAVSVLVEVGALTQGEDITPLGRLLSKLPTDVHLGKFLLTAASFKCLDPALTIAATLNYKSPFITPMGLEAEAERAKVAFRTGNSDFLTIHSAFSGWRKASATRSQATSFCRTNYLSQQNLQQIEELRQQLFGCAFSLETRTRSNDFVVSYLVDSSFIKVDKSIVRELSRARGFRGRTRFVPVPPDLDANSSNAHIVHAALAAGLYPKVLSYNAKTGAMIAITNNQTVHIHPSSVNFNRNLSDANVGYFTYFTLMQSRRLYAWEIGPVDELFLLLLCGESEFKFQSEMVQIDRKVRFHVSPKTAVAIKILRERLVDTLSSSYSDKPISATQEKWEQLALIALGRLKPAAEQFSF